MLMLALTRRAVVPGERKHRFLASVWTGGGASEDFSDRLDASFSRSRDAARAQGRNLKRGDWCRMLPAQAISIWEELDNGPK